MKDVSLLVTGPACSVCMLPGFPPASRLLSHHLFTRAERYALRPGNIHSAHGWRDVLDPVVVRYRGQALRRLLRGDAAFALPDVYEYLEPEGFQ